MTAIVEQLKVVKPKVVDRRDLTLEAEGRERMRLSVQLRANGFNVVLVNVVVSDHVDELLRSEAGHVGDHVGEQGVAGDVEGYAEPEVCGPLVHQATELPGFGMHEELERVMTFEEKKRKVQFHSQQKNEKK